MEQLNLLLKDWQQYPNLWRHTEGSITLVAADYDYTLSPVPHRVISARYRNSSGNDLPMELLSREEFYELPDKSVAGVPTEYYVDYQHSSAVFNVWQVPASITTETIKYTYQKKFDDIDSLDNDVEVRSEHYNALGYNLAALLADDYGRNSPVTERVIARSVDLFNELLDADREDFVQFVPGYGTYGY